jgi:sugar transferase (PEP-CTERM system associated)
MLRLFRHHVPMWSLVELLADGLLCFVAILVASTRLPAGPIDPDLAFPEILRTAAAFTLLMALLYGSVGLYRQGAIWIGIRALSGRGLAALGLGAFIAYVLIHRRDGVDAFVLLANAVPLMAIGIIAVRGAGHAVRIAAVGARRVLIVGTGPDAVAVARDLAADLGKRHTVVGFYPTYAADPEAARAQGLSAPVFGAGIAIDEVVRKHHVDEVIVAVREQRGGGVPMDQLLACRIRGIPVLHLAGFFERAKGEVPIDSLKASWLVYGHGFVQGVVRTAVKRAFDIAMSLILLAIFAPVMVVTALAIRLESRGPIIYRQERVGLRGRPFMCLKFRSMCVDAEKDGVARWAAKNDVRITRVGAFIRKCRIDELPQLFSVLRGEMSLVGPRPERPSFVEQLQAEIPFYDIRHSVKPGVTGWAQVRYTYGASIEDARKKHQFDLYYVKNHSLFLDVLILVETVSVVVFREGAQ